MKWKHGNQIDVKEGMKRLADGQVVWYCFKPTRLVSGKGYQIYNNGTGKTDWFQFSVSEDLLDSEWRIVE